MTDHFQLGALILPHALPFYPRKTKNHEKILSNRSVKHQALGHAIHQHLHKLKFPLMQVERFVIYINRLVPGPEGFYLPRNETSNDPLHFD